MTWNPLHRTARMLFSVRTLPAGIAGLVIGSVLGLLILLWAGRPVNTVIRSAYELDGVVAQGGHLDVVFDVDRLRDCPAETSRWLWTWVNVDGRRLKQFFPLTETSTALTNAGLDQRFILSVPLPPGVWPGEWYYLSRTVEHCPFLPNLFRPTVRQSPDISVHIESGEP